MMTPHYSIVIPVYRNREFLPEVLAVLEKIAHELDGNLEAVFVVDGSPDDSEQWLTEHLPGYALPSRLIALSRNFGSFTAVRVGLGAARGEHIAVMAADLQEPPSLIVDMLRALASGHEVAVGTRLSRDDPSLQSLPARVFWRLYRALVDPQMPREGVDVFAVSRGARDALLALEECHTSLVVQLFWIGFRRIEIPYHRRARQHGTSGWTLRRKLGYLFDSLFAFTDLPIKLLTAIGLFGTVAFLAIGIALLVLRLSGAIAVPGYTAIMVTILFSSSLVLFGLGIVGNYVWRTYENTKRRPLGIVRARCDYPASPREGAAGG
jgi:polyisoprenyl-phosphate glycosyltransferase